MPTACLISSYSPSLINFRGPLIEALQGRGYRVVAFGPADAAVEARLRAHDVEFVPVGPQRTSANPLGDLRYLRGLISALRAKRPELVLSYTAKPVIWGSIAAQLAGAQRIAAMITGLGSAFTSDDLRTRMLQGVLLALYRTALRACDHVVFQNPDDRNEFVSRGLIDERRTLLVNGSGVDVDGYHEQLLPTRPVFLLIARLIADKGIREYVSAARIVRERFPEAEFRLVGWFDDNPSAISRAEVEGWASEGVIRYLGPSEDVRVELGAARIYVLPSYREGTPRTILEAMATGRPIITTDVPGCRETVEHEWNGLLVPREDARALAEAMERLLREPQLCERMGKRSRELVVRRYEARAVASSLLDGIGA